ncbi:Peptidase M18 2 domain-containing protein [Rozella allomycis CSF55]|uniref:aspartyl aminopeptidase n=1 Tax=Rozella allomycis (strain CSF55) TaxID=988480 RepID=A0A075AVV7_ROZAC|nr:Peptidase M18 2 domain-containing protein [Rozella allomycis CSF55]|eukprot:EPZ34400.1 Peptidase M18 2 domain-containing protein [Rozella allomycis CSF55]
MQSNEQARNLLKFIEKSPSPFHAVEEVKQKLIAVGFKELSERKCWPVFKPSEKYFFTRNSSSIIAFHIGSKYKPGNGFSIIAAHTDSPCLKVKPISKIVTKNYLQIGVQTYGGGLWHTWFDRDLSVAGRVIVEENGLKERLVKIDRIPTLAIHLDRSVNEGFNFNKESNFVPIFSLGCADEKSKNHHEQFLQLLAEELKVQSNQILDFELCLYDTQAPNFGGLNNEFIQSARLDNLLMSYIAMESFMQSASNNEQENITMTALFDNEEVGSSSAYGAGSNLLKVSLERILESLECQKHFHETIQRSYLISADCAHAIHPNYSDKHEQNHAPRLNEGIVIKVNANQRYATTSLTSSIFKQIANKNNIPFQEFVVKNDSPCGSTIGPILSTLIGIRTIGIELIL